MHITAYFSAVLGKMRDRGESSLNVARYHFIAGRKPFYALLLDAADALRHASLEAAPLFFFRDPETGRNLIPVRYEGGHGLLLFALGHLVIFKGTPELQCDSENRLSMPKVAHACLELLVSRRAVIHRLCLLRTACTT